jgi:hypothetical protein
MSFQLIITIIIITFLRKSLRMQETMPEWNKKFKGMIFVAVALLVLHFSYSGSDVITQWVSVLLLSWLIFILYENEEFKSVSFLLTAVIPYLVVTVITYIIKLIDIQLYNEWKQWLEAANTFAVIWGFGTWFITRRQRRELAKARKKLSRKKKIAG